VDKLIVVVEPGRRSLETARVIKRLAEDIGLKNIAIVGNKVRSETDKEFLVSSLPGLEFLGFIPYDQAIVDADLASKPVITASQKVVSEVKKIFNKLVPVTQKSKQS